MTDDKQALVMLGQIMGRLDERARTDEEFRQRLARIEDGVTKRLDDHGKRINALEINVARESIKHGALGGGGAGALIVAFTEVIRKVLGH